ncbi:MAG TPA: 50S ribosomal protein L6 [Kiritimatiellia bacterium]|nr:50S ribosomal protein L6 [Kiritimatiellia bacterium]HNR93201.1 50S ribosomal protein L6 [Kiritimatiellia bacterium]HNS81169.1 50S ribosomal protein L6 [Kiritimatiellia bacterium]
MSRVGKNPVELPAGVTAEVGGNTVKIKGPKGELSLDVAPGISVEVKDGRVLVSRAADDKQSRALHGTVRSLVANMVKGVTQGYRKELEIYGVGYKARMEGRKLVLNLGYSHPIEYMIPEGVKITVPKPEDVGIEGVDKHLVGQVADRIRSFAPAEPYKGKGVRYKGEKIRRKAGKTVA